MPWEEDILNQFSKDFEKKMLFFTSRQFSLKESIGILSTL